MTKSPFNEKSPDAPKQITERPESAKELKLDVDCARQLFDATRAKVDGALRVLHAQGAISGETYNALFNWVADMATRSKEIEIAFYKLANKD
ncbi:MAG: hypothetical protein J6R99_02835 [Alphaproteobacteria bacterium]|nr:hypothetical protein [Alphaproteobacteria bacterium]MBO7066622.1 hypothetical protein [Alphaproteobacteria bacterium]